MTTQYETPSQTDIDKIKLFLENELTDEAKKYIRLKNLGLRIDGKRIVHLHQSTSSWLEQFITADEAMLQMKEDVKRLAPLDDEVLIVGASGTGKELIARALHGEKEGKFVAINCAGLPEELIESELFGHVKGAFTGAVNDKDGLMYIANKGTLFLDEIGELPMMAQAKLLRAIQERKIRKVGGDKDIAITCRLVAATHRDLLQMMESELFREDLYARISTFVLNITPLAVRQHDIELIVKSMDGGPQFWEMVTARKEQDNEFELNIRFNVRSLQQYVKRYKVLGRM